MDVDSNLAEEIDEVREGFAAISLSKETKQRIRAPWAKAITIKVFGRTVGFTFLHTKIMRLWKPTCKVDMVDLGKDFFLVTFSSQEDLEAVLKKGPWFIGEHFLSICKWEANFKLSEAIVTSVAVWVRLNELLIEYYKAVVLRQIGQALGNVLRVDTHTAVEARGRYAQICVQVDISKPLVTTVHINERKKNVIYEGLHKLCFSCGHIDHWKEACQYTIRLPSLPTKADNMEKAIDNEAQTPPPFEVQETESKDAVFGPRMVVS